MPRRRSFSPSSSAPARASPTSRPTAGSRTSACIDSLAEHLQDGFSLLSPDGVHLDVNAALCAMTGFSREELVGVGLPHPYWPPEEQRRLARDMRRTSRGERRPRSSRPSCARDGERFPVLITPSVDARRGRPAVLRLRHDQGRQRAETRRTRRCARAKRATAASSRTPPSACSSRRSRASSST